MNKLFFLFFLVILISCNKDKDLSLDYWGTATVAKADEIWKPLVYANVDTRGVTPGFTIRLNTFDEANNLRETFGFEGIPRKIGKYRVFRTGLNDPSLFPRNVYTTHLEDGDVAGDIYDPLDSADNYVEITELKGNKVRGKFQTTLYRRQHRPKFGNNPDTLKFLEGAFFTKIR